jgi:hypothetical protein
MERGRIKGFALPEKLNGFVNFVVEKEDGASILVPIHMSMLAEIAKFEIEYNVFIPVIGREVLVKDGKIMEFL